MAKEVWDQGDMVCDGRSSRRGTGRVCMFVRGVVGRLGQRWPATVS